MQSDILLLKNALKMGFENGFENGLEEGKKKGLLEIAKQLLNLDMPIEQITQITKLSEEEITNIK